MGKANKSSQSLSATELIAGGTPVSEAGRLGRCLTLRFVDGPKPELNSAEFLAHARCARPALIRQRDRDHSFNWGRTPMAFSLLFLEYKCAALEGREQDFHFAGARRRSLAATLGDALKRNTGAIYDLFSEDVGKAAPDRCIQSVFQGRNLDGGEDNERRFEINHHYLPGECVQIYINGVRVDDPAKLRDFGRRIREAYKLEPSRQPPPPATGPPIPPPPASPAQQPRQPELLPETAVRPPPRKEPSVQPEPAPQAEAFKLSKFLADEFGKALDALRHRPSPAPKPDAPPPPSAPPAKEKARPAKPADEEEAKPDNQPDPEAAPEPEAPEPTPIAPELFVVSPANGNWPDEAPLVELPDDESVHAWTLKSAFEGILILGRTGSGKTTGSGTTFAEAFLRAGFGGLVLTVKSGEAEYWRRLCALCGRENDLVVVQRGGNWKLNLLAYEAQHPGRGGALSENLTTFCRNLLVILARNKGTSASEQFWESAGDQLLNATFDLFLLAGGGITFDRLADFVAAAPTDSIPQTEEEWLKVPTFGGIYQKAKKAAVSPEDKRIFNRASQYWLTIYPGLSSRTRTSVTLGVYAMFDTFRGRDIPALISSETNLTPESVMGGKIVVLDLPLKEFQHAGLMVQSAWKYLFQVALERQKRANNPACRPVFLWEDEAQHFFSQHDHHFQNTARSARVCRVILTQNLHSFYKEFGRDGESATMTVFGNLNTKVFHNNSDTTSNRWAADQFGKVINQRLSISKGPEPQPKEFFDAMRQSIDPPGRTTVSTVEHWEDAVRPEEFNDLRTGGPDYNFMVDAYITWMGLVADDGNHFLKISFQQNQHL